MFKKVLVANRGEIAVRVFRACGERGLSTVAVYSDVDRAALHVRYADEAYRIGPPPARESYLHIPAIIQAARDSGADAVHPGYGFLSENEEFAQAVIDAGLVWIGPSPAAIKAMGDKVTARRTMMAAGVPVVPGTEAGISDEDAVAAASAIGYPLLVKASAGGGGKGMRVVNGESEMPASIQAARREALGAFGDDTVYLEKLITNARHVEIQILADNYGNCIYLGERECSIQRRHQKLIEEAPSIAVTPELRARMGQVGVAAAQAASYSNAGTIEFLLDRDGNFYFLEMNTRLQVEHPVTEMVTGVDIVKEQLSIADGRKLRYRQEDIQIKGHAIECRINAEDPFNGFLPQAGRVNSMTEPTGPGVRFENGIYDGFDVTPYYDPLLAKLVAWGETRAEAILRMRRALEELRINGLHTTIPFHEQMMDSTRFQSGQFDTNFVESGAFRLAARGDPRTGRIAALAAVLVEHDLALEALTMQSPCEGRVEGISPWRLGGRGGWRS